MPEQHAIVLRVAVPGLPVWRRLEVPAQLELEGLHRVILAAFDWGLAEGHRFGRGAWEAPRWLPPAEAEALTVEMALPEAGAVLLYQYDLAHTWPVEVRSEGFVAVEDEARLPRCTDGEGAEPPEDWAGPQDYLQRVEALGNPLEGLDPDRMPADVVDEDAVDADDWDDLGLGVDPEWDPELFHPDLVNARLTDLSDYGTSPEPDWLGERLAFRLDQALLAFGEGEAEADDPELAIETLRHCPTKRRLDALAKEVDPALLEWIRAVLEAHSHEARMLEPARHVLSITGHWQDAVQYALALTHQGRGEEAREVLGRYRDQASRIGDPIAYEAAEALQQGIEGDAEGAEARLRDLIASEPDPFVREPAVVTLADLLESIGRDEEAEKLLADEDAAKDADIAQYVSPE